MEDHPQYIDVIKVILPNPLPPGDTAILTTPFHVQLPYNFAGSGYHQGIYQVTQWYPKPAVYDNSGWHPDPYLGQGDSYSEFGDFDVRITIPANFTVAASAKPQSPPDTTNPSIKTLHYHGSNIPDFAWFASRRFQRIHDTLQLPSGRIIDLYSYYIRPNSPIARHSIAFMKAAIRFYSALLGEYPFDLCTAAETREVSDQTAGSGAARASYPAIIGIDSRDSTAFNLDMTIEKEIGDNWISIAVGANGRRFPWMTDGISQYYYDRYRLKKYGSQKYGPPFPEYFVPDTFHRSEVNTRIVLKEDQPGSTSSDDFTPDNYRTTAEWKTAIWLLEIQRSLGASLFDSCMHEYFRRQQFHHSSPASLKTAFTAAAARLNLDSVFSLPDRRDPVPPSPYHRRLELNPQLIPHPTHNNRLNISPALGFNNYDHFMIGALIHNYNLPPDNWQLLAAPLYATESHQFNGLVHFNYAWYPHRSFRLIEAGINASRFSTISGTDSNSHSIFGGFYKVVPYLRLFFPKSSPRSTQDSWLEWKTYFIGEKSFNNYVLKSTDSLYYPTVGKYEFRYLNQLSFTILDSRVLYPYRVNLQVKQAAPFYRVNLNINYLFNYESGGGLAIRLFGAKFGYIGGQDLSRTSRLSSPN